MPYSALPLMASPFVVPTRIDHQRIIRAVASSTAIETGQSTHEIELKLHADDSKYQLLDLAPTPVSG